MQVTSHFRNILEHNQRQCKARWVPELIKHLLCCILWVLQFSLLGSLSPILCNWLLVVVVVVEVIIVLVVVVRISSGGVAVFHCISVDNHDRSVRLYYFHNVSVYLKLVRHKLSVIHCCNVYNCWLKMMFHAEFASACELFPYQISNAWWFITYFHQTKAKYTFHATKTLLFYIKKNPYKDWKISKLCSRISFLDPIVSDAIWQESVSDMLLLITGN